MAKRVPKNRTNDEVAVVPLAVQPAADGSADEEEIGRLAHQYWMERGSPIGTPEEDWFRAVEEIKRRRQRPEPPA